MNKQALQFLSAVVFALSIGIPSLMLMRLVDFTLPLGLFAIVLGLAALWLQGESK